MAAAQWGTSRTAADLLAQPLHEIHGLMNTHADTSFQNAGTGIADGKNSEMIGNEDGTYPTFLLGTSVL